MGVQTVAIIGAGAGGLTAIKACLEDYLQPQCFEKTADIGGIWNYTEDTTRLTTSVYSSLVTNTSKDMSSFSDFPFPAAQSQYMSHREFMLYLRRYSDQFELGQHIQFETEVIHVGRHSSYEETGKWIVNYKGADDIACERTFDAVLVCTGNHSKPIYPTIPGSQSFRGTELHSNNYRKSDLFRDRNILIVGNGNSAGDIACDASNIGANKVYVSTGIHGTNLLERMLPASLLSKPILDHNISRYSTLLPMSIRTMLAENVVKTRINQAAFGFGTDRPLLQGNTVLNDQLAFHILSGAVTMKGEVVEITEHGARFGDGSELTDIDMIVWATGFSPCYPFLENGIMTDSVEECCLYKWVWPVLPHPTLAVIGRVSIQGPACPALELQTRWATQVFIGNSHLPSGDAIHQYHTKSVARIKTNYGYFKFKLQAPDYHDSIASEIGVKPSFWRILPRDPSLAFKIFFGPPFSAHYRLQGVHSNKNAANLSKAAYRNMNYPIMLSHSRSANKAWLQSIAENMSSIVIMLYIVIVAVIFVSILR